MKWIAVLALACLLSGETPADAQVVGTVNFDFNSDQLDAEAAREVQALADRIRSQAGYRQAIVVGYTDAVGSEAYNQQLGLRRAQAIANALIADGVPVSRIGTVSSLGENDLLVNVSTRERANRRAVVSLDDMLAACRSYRQISLGSEAIGPQLQQDLQQRLATAASAYSQFSATGQNPAAFQMAGAAREDCSIAVSLGDDQVRKVEFARKCLCNSARLQVAIN